MIARTATGGVLAFAALLFASSALGQGGQRLADQLQGLYEAEKEQCKADRERFAQLAEDCIAKDVGSTALDALEILETLDPGFARLEALREKAKGLGSPTAAYRSWGSGQLKRACREAAKGWKDLVKEAERRRFPHAAAKFASMQILFDPDDRNARKILGHVQWKRQWWSKYDCDQAKLGLVFDPAWGYVTEEEKERLEKGERPVGSRWRSAEEDANRERTWEERRIFKDPYVVLISNLPYDQACAVYVECRKLSQQLDHMVGNFFRPKEDKWPVRLFLCKGSKAMDKAMESAGWQVGFGSGGSLYVYDFGSNCLFVRADDVEGDGKGDGEVDLKRLRSSLRSSLVEWFLEGTSEEYRNYFEQPNRWAKFGLEALAGAGGLFREDFIPQYGELEEYGEDLKEGRLPSLKDLFSKTDNVIEAGESMKGAVLCHYLLHAEGGKHRLRFLGLVHDFLLGSTSAGSLPDALGMTVEDLEKALQAHTEKCLEKKAEEED